MALTELKGQETGTQKVVIERGPVRVFAEALGDDDDVYSGDDALVPPTFPFVMSYWGSLGTGGAAGLPIDRLRGPGRAILHGDASCRRHLTWRIRPTWSFWYPLGYQKLRITPILHLKRSVFSTNASHVTHGAAVTRAKDRCCPTA